MTPLSLSQCLLAAAALLLGVADAAPQEHFRPPSVPKPAEKEGDVEYPQLRSVYTYNEGNLTRYRHVHKCLQDWCERRELIWERGGKVKCSSDHPTEENVVAWICNVDWNRHSCSPAMLNLAAKALIDQRGAQDVDDFPSGHVYYSAARGHSLIFGWDTYCAGSAGCGGYSDPTIVCENFFDSQRHKPAPKPNQFDSISNDYGSVKHHGYVDEDAALVALARRHGDDEEYRKYQEKEAIRDLPIKHRPINSKVWPSSQWDKTVSGMSEMNRYHNPKHKQDNDC